MKVLADDLPINLKPEYKYCVDREEAEKIQICFDENAVCHSVVKNGNEPGTLEVILIGAGVFLAGLVVGHQIN